MGNILVVEDKPTISHVLQGSPEIEVDHTVIVLNGEDAVQFALRKMPRLIVIDLVGMGEDGYAIIQRLRSQARCMYIPIVVVSAMTRASDKVRVFKMGVDDYITTPFDPDEFRARILTQLRHVQQVFSSRLIDLPGAYQVEMAINCRLASKDPWSILYLDLDNFKAFNDAYGFLAGNEMIRLVGRLSRRAVYEHGNLEDFVGHIGGDDFVVVTTPDCARALGSRIIGAYRESSRAFYRPDDLKRGYISGLDRKGRPYQFPLVSLSIGIVHNHPRLPQSIQELSYLVAEAKRHAKQATGNIYYISSRTCQTPDCLPPITYASANASLSSSMAFSSIALGSRDVFPRSREDSIAAEYEQQIY